MKKLFILLLAIAASSCQDFAEAPFDTVEDNSATTRAVGSDGQDYYWYQGEKIHLTRSNDFVNVIAADGKLKKFSKSEAAGNYMSAPKETDKYVMPYFERGVGAEPIGTSDIFYLKLKAAEDGDMLKKMAAELGVQVIEEIPYTPLWYTLSIIGSDFSNSIEASNHFYETGQFEDVDPAFMFDFKPSADDSEFWRQWGMVATSNYDINVVPAWTITRGAGVKVAIVDTPIQSNHTDLNDNMHSLSYNANLKQTPSASYSGDSHGTHVAGIVAAKKNGSMVTGVAYESEIVRVSHYLGASNTIASELASGINWAWKATNDGGAGVDVINCSWGDRDGYGNVHSELHSTVLEQAIVDAMTQGRGDKGCVVVFAAGNWGVMNYPGNFHSNILTVGAIDNTGSRAIFYNGQSSGFGASLDVVAPGKNIWSTIYPSTTGNMSGTSMAAPHVAGVAALMLSANPNLTVKQVGDIIESSAQKVGGYSYLYTNGQANGRWNEQMGHGLVDAYTAVVTATPAIVPNTPIISDELVPYQENNSVIVTVVFSVNNHQPGVTYQWEVYGRIQPNENNPYLAFLSDFPLRALLPMVTVRCRAVLYNGTASAWSNSISHIVKNLDPIPLPPPLSPP